MDARDENDEKTYTAVPKIQGSIITLEFSLTITQLSFNFLSAFKHVELFSSIPTEEFIKKLSHLPNTRSKELINDMRAVCRGGKGYTLRAFQDAVSLPRYYVYTFIL